MTCNNLSLLDTRIIYITYEYNVCFARFAKHEKCPITAVFPGWFLRLSGNYKSYTRRVLLC